jgi:hypothetical protein
MAGAGARPPGGAPADVRFGRRAWLTARHEARYLLEMRHLLASAVLAALALPSVALAGDDDGKIRIKLDTPVFASDTTSRTNNDSDDTYSETRTGLSLGTGAARLYGGYVLSPNIELGAAIGFASYSDSYSNDDDDEDVGKGSTLGLLACATFNKSFAESFGGFATGKVGIANTSYEPDGGDESALNFLAFGAEAGGRYRVNRRAALEGGLEFLAGSGSASYDGDEDKDNTYGFRSISVRFGVSVKL